MEQGFIKTWFNITFQIGRSIVEFYWYTLYISQAVYL